MLDKLVMGNNHVMFNSAISLIIARIYKDHQVIFTGESTHINQVAQNNSFIENLVCRSYEELPLPQSNIKKLLPWIKKKLGDLLYIEKFYRRTKKDGVAIFFTCLSTTSLYYACLRFRNSRKPVYFVLHGEVEFIFKKDARLVDKVKGRIYRATLGMMEKHMHCIVLSDIVKMALEKKQVLTSERIIAIDHPIVDRQITHSALNADTIIFAHIGSAMQKKRSELFWELADKFRNESIQRKSEFSVIGKLDPEFVGLATDSVKVLSENNQSISQEKYEQFIHNADYAVFTFDNDNYVYRVSGALMDAILYGKPIIALRQDYIEYLFQVGGNIGFLCDNMDKMQELIKRLINKEPVLLEQYTVQQQRLKALKEMFSVKSVAEQLNKQL